MSFNHRKDIRPQYWYIYEKLPFIPHRPEYGANKIIWDTEMVIDHNTEEFDKHSCFDEVLRSKTDRFLVIGIVHSPLFNEGDDFGKWIIQLHKIENGKLTEKYEERYNTRGSSSIRFIEKMNYKEAQRLKNEYLGFTITP